MTLVSASPLYRQAEGFKEQGNAFYSKKDYSEAFNYYTKAIGEIAITYHWNEVFAMFGQLYTAPINQSVLILSCNLYILQG